MKNRLFTLLICLMGVLCTHAEDFTHLTFVTVDGEKVSMPIENLEISISGNTLTAGNQSFTLVNLSKMYFSSSDETTLINELKSTDFDEAVHIFDLNGRKVNRDQMTSGVYVIKTKQGTYKLMVR